MHWTLDGGLEEMTVGSGSNSGRKTSDPRVYHPGSPREPGLGCAQSVGLKAKKGGPGDLRVNCGWGTALMCSLRSFLQDVL
jgi:hypothetical protein